MTQRCGDLLIPQRQDLLIAASIALIMPKVSGNLIHMSKKYLAEKYPPEVGERVYAGVPERSRATLQGAIFSSNMYEDYIFQDFLDSLVKNVGLIELDKIADYSAEKQLVGFFGLIAKFMSFPKFMSLGPMMWKKVYDTGYIQPINVNENEVQFQVREYKFSEHQLSGFAFYIKGMIRHMFGGQILISIKKIDETTNEFIFRRLVH